MTKTTTQADAPVRKCTNDVLSVPRERFLILLPNSTAWLSMTTPMSTTTTKAWKASLTSQTIF